MVKKPLIWTSRAKAEKRNILQFWVYNNTTKTYAINLNQEFKEYAQFFEKFHFLGKPTNFPNVRVLIIKNF
jgi:hypothetical protein